MEDPHRFILASASPRRSALLHEAGYRFDVHPADIDEEALSPAGAMPADVAVRLAEAKAEKIAQQFPSQVVLAADTIVAFGDQLIGKAKDVNHAREILTLLAGTTQIIITGVSVRCIARNIRLGTRVWSAARMRNLRPSEIEDYLRTNDWQGKAGAYGIQDDDPFVTRMSGSVSNIVGLPMHATRQLLRSAGIQPQRESRPDSSGAD